MLQPHAHELDNRLLPRVNRHQAKTILHRYPAEVASCINNLGNVLVALSQGTPVNAIPFPFFRPEGGGVFRIGQTGVPSAREMRLYVTFVFVRGVAYVFSIGTKSTQSRGIVDSIRAAQQIRREKHEHPRQHPPANQRHD